MVANKLIFQRCKYRKGSDYDAQRYWEDRFKKYELNIKGPGFEGASVKDNVIRYKRVLNHFERLWKLHLPQNHLPKTLEIGVGAGMITECLKGLGVADYVGIDITDYLFWKLQAIYPDYKFIRADVTAEKIKDKFDVIVIIDVLQHIVTREKINTAFYNLDQCLKSGGLIFLAPLTESTGKRQFYEHSWRLCDINVLSGYQHLGEAEWNIGFSKIIVLKKPTA